MLFSDTKSSSEIDNVVDWSAGTGSGQHYANVRFGSSSSQTSQTSGDICRICHCESDPQNPLLTPCYCSGSLKYVHQACLQQWLTASETNSCELCKFPFIMQTKIKPFNEWRSLDISGVERRRLCCSVLFHCAAALCVIWSLCVLIERAADDVKRGLIDWPFWTKLAVVTVGLTGGVVFMYIQCKAYLHLCHRWKARNRILLIQNAPEKMHPLSPPSPVRQHHSRFSGAEEEARNVDEDSSIIQAGSGARAAPAVNCGNASVLFLTHSEIDAYANANHSNAALFPRRVLQPDDLDIIPSSTRMVMANGGNLPVAQQDQIVANIECSQLQQNYERDWALDDVVSQISSFRPCPQGSGSMTPFHDSIHNVLEHSQGSSRGSVNDVCGISRHDDLSTGGVSSDTARDHALQLSSLSESGIVKEPSMSSGVSAAVANGLGGFVYKPPSKRYSNSSIFLENRDILNDSVILSIESSPSGDDSICSAGLSKLNYRHSSILTPPLVDAENLNKLPGKNLRRYSDTKLLASDTDLVDNHIFKADVVDAGVVPLGADMNMSTPIRSVPKGRSKNSRSIQIMDRKFENSQPTATMFETQMIAEHRKQNLDKNCIFKSLPNLSGSSESLIKI